MRFILLVVILSIWSQNVASKEVPYQNSVKTLAPIQNVKDLRGMKEIWDNIRNSAKIAWTSLKNIANNTKEKINVWIQNVKDRANEITKQFKDQLQILKEKSKAVLEDILGKGQLVKECLKKDKEVINNILKQILDQFTSCVSENISKLKQFKDERQSKIYLPEDKFIEEIEEKLNKCLSEEINDPEECLYNVRQEVFAVMETMEDEILTNRMESRTVADDILDALISCSVNGFMDSSTAIANETVEIIKCVLEDGFRQL